MTPNKQVSLAIRILRGERDASARAIHLEAATRKFLVTTNERKYMSTKTNFKRIALVAVAALGLGVLSSVPSQAEITGLTLTVVDGSATLAKSDSTTAATITIAGLLESADSITVDGSGTSYYGSPSVTVAGSWYPLTQNSSASTITRLSNGNYLLTATIYIDSTVDSALFVAATGGLDVDAIPNEVTTRIILNSSKSSILAQAINIGAKGVK